MPVVAAVSGRGFVGDLASEWAGGQVGAGEQVWPEHAHPAPTSKTRPPKLQRKERRRKEKVNKKNLRKQAVKVRMNRKKFT